MNNCIEIIGLSYKEIFQDFSIAFEKNKFITLSGPNNCGKTTLIRIIDRQLPTTNSILVNSTKLEDLKITELNNIIKTIIPLEITFTQATVEEEVYSKLPVGLNKEERQKQVKKILKDLKLNKISTKSVETLNEEETIRLQLALSLVDKKEILLIDDLSTYFEEKSLLDIIKYLKDLTIKENLTIVMVLNNLEYSLETDYIYVLVDSEIIIEGTPLEVLEKDNILNKAGLELPFMMDLSVKLRDYDLIKSPELDMERLVDTLWN